jgi:hypothetical protein
MGTFYSKDGPIQTEKDYDVVKRVPEGQVVYNSKFPNLVFYQNQVLPMRNGVIVNYQDSDWVMENYQNYLSKYSQKQPTTPIKQTEAPLSEENTSKKLIDLIREINAMQDLEDVISLNNEFSDADLKKLEEKYGIYTSSKGELLIKENASFEQIKSLVTLLLRYEAYLFTGNKDIFKKDSELGHSDISLLAKKELKKLLHIPIPIIYEKSGNTNEAISYAISSIYDKNMEFDELDIELASIISEKGKEYYKSKNKPYFSINLEKNQLSIEAASNLMKFIPFYFKDYLGFEGEDDFIEIEQMISAIPSAIFGKDLIDFLYSKKPEISRLLKNFFSDQSTGLIYSTWESLRKYEFSKYDKTTFLLSLYDSMLEQIDREIRKLSFISTNADGKSDAMFNAVKGILSAYLSNSVMYIMKNQDLLDDLRSVRPDEGYSILSDKLIEFEKNNNFLFLSRALSPRNQSTLEAKILLGFFSNENLDNQKIKDFLQKDIKDIKAKKDIKNYDLYLQDIEKIFTDILNPSYRLRDEIQQRIEDSFGKAHPYVKNKEIISVLPFIFSNLNNPVISSGIDKDFLKGVMNIITEEISKTLQNPSFSDDLKEYFESLLEETSNYFKDEDIKSMSKFLVSILLSTNETNTPENTEKVNELFKKMMQKLKNSTSTTEFVENSEFISETVKMFEDLFHPQYNAYIGFIEMKQSLNILHLKKELYQELVDLEESNYTLASALQESLLQRKDSLIYPTGYENFQSDQDKNIAAKKERKEFIDNAKLRSVEVLKEAIDKLKNKDFTTTERYVGEELEKRKKELIGQLSYIANFINSEYKTEPLYKLNEAFYNALDIIKSMYQFSSDKKTRDTLISIGAEVFYSKFSISDILMENKNNTNFTISVSSGSPSTHISGHIFLMKLVKDLDRYKEIAVSFTSKYSAIPLLTISKYNQKRTPIINISRDSENKLYIDFAHSIFYPYYGTSSSSDQFAVSESVIKPNIISSQNIPSNLSNRISSTNFYDNIPRPLLSSTKTQEISLDSLKELLFSGPKTLERMSYAESMVCNFPLLVSNEKFMGPIRPVIDNIYNFKDLRDKGTRARPIVVIKRSLSKYARESIKKLKLSTSPLELEEHKRSLNEYLGASTLDNFNVNSFDHLIDDERGMFRETFGEITGSEYKRNKESSFTSNYTIQVTTKSKEGISKNFTIVPSYISINSFKRISSKFLNNLLNQYIEKKTKSLQQNLNEEERKLIEVDAKEIEGKINDFTVFLEMVNVDDYKLTTGMLNALFDSLGNLGRAEKDFSNFLAEQLLFDSSLGLAPAFVYDEDSIVFAPHTYNSNKIEDTYHAHMHPLYLLGNISPRFMYKIGKFTKKFIDKTTDEKFSSILKNLSKGGVLKLVPGFFRAYHFQGNVLHDILDAFKRIPLANALQESNESDLDELERQVDLGFFDKEKEEFIKLGGGYTFGFDPGKKDTPTYQRRILYEFIKDFKTTLFHEIGHQLDFEEDEQTRNSVYKKFNDTLKEVLKELKSSIASDSSIREDLKGSLYRYIDEYTQKLLTSTMNRADYKVYESFLSFIYTTDKPVREELYKIFERKQSEGLLLNTYALFNSVEIPSTVLEYASILGEEEFKKRFPKYIEVLDYLLEIAKNGGYL